MFKFMGPKISINLCCVVILSKCISPNHQPTYTFKVVRHTFGAHYITVHTSGWMNQFREVWVWLLFLFLKCQSKCFSYSSLAESAKRIPQVPHRFPTCSWSIRALYLLKEMHFNDHNINIMYCFSILVSLVR